MDGKPVGLIGVKDVVRRESAALLGQLQEAQAMHTVMLTGDNVATAQAIAREAGIKQVYAGLLPGEKMERVEELKREYGTVAMVGDGINDAPALALADVGIAMGAASSDTAIEVADVALMANNIEVLPAFFKLARKVVNTIHTNIVFALVVKATVMVLAIVGLAQMWMAIFADVGVLILVLLYGMRLSFSRGARS
ncbi:MAG: HAD-IC family P-type ATPase, partial [Coriobacteriales bacterium]|jgi:Cd2+/Zn2+-exporting ATPase|nr:HAD-IC family P-type ATPase [Coriobacteriales bacterium]